MDGSGNASLAVDEIGTRPTVDRHHGSMAQQTSELHGVTHRLALHGDDAHGRGLLVHHTDGRLVGFDASVGSSSRIARI